MWTNESGQDICLNADKSQVVPCDSSDAAFLLVGPGGQVSDEDAERYGLVKGKKQAKAEPAEAPAAVEAEAESESKAEPAEKAAPKSADKAVKAAPENKAKKG